MGLTTRFLPHSVLVKTAGAAVNAWVNQIDSLNPNEGTSLFEESAGSQTDREFVASRDIAPTISFSTTDLSVLSTIGFSGVPIFNDGSNPGVMAFARELPLGAVPTAIATAHHQTIQVSDGLLIPVSLSAAHNAVAKLSLLLHAINGTGSSSLAAPMVVSAGQAITSGAGAVVNIYTTGPVKYTVSGGSSRLVQGIADINISFGIQILKEGTDGDVFPSQVAIISRTPSITFTTKDTELLSEIGNGISVSAFAAYFRQVNSAGQRVAVGTGSHISVSGTAGMVSQGSLSLAHKSAGSLSFTYTPTLNTNTITIATNATIPTS